MRLLSLLAAFLCLERGTTSIGHVDKICLAWHLFTHILSCRFQKTVLRAVELKKLSL